MNSFNITRFGQTLRWLIAVNYRTIRLWTTGTALMVFLGEMALALMLNFEDPYIMIYQYAMSSTTLLILIATILANRVASSINDKRRRGVFLMLPATNAEKHLSLIIYSSVVCMLCTFFALTVGDTLRMVWYWMAGAPEGKAVIRFFDGVTWYWHSSAIPMILDNLNFRFGYGIQDTTYVMFKYIVHYFIFAWVHSLLTLGGTLLRKYSFVATSALLILCIVMFYITLDRFDLKFFDEEWEYNEKWEYTKVIAYDVGVGYILAVALPLLTVFNYWASYRTFKGFQVINHKWINL